MDQFETYFRRADLDGDGRISGAEAVGFFQGSGLPKQVLAQIWSYADRSRSGFLGRQEFFNALRLVTVAQSKRDLTPEIVNAALNTPAAAKIPPPKINLSAIPGQQTNVVATSPQISPVSSTPAPNASVNQNYFLPQQNQMMRPTQGMPGLSTPRPTPGPAGPDYRARPVPGQLQALPGGTVSRLPQAVSTSISVSNISTDWYAGKSGGYSSGSGAVSTAGPSAVSTPQLPIAASLQPKATDSKSSIVSGNGTAPSSGFGSDVFSTIPFQQKQESPASLSTNSSAIVPASSGGQSSPRPSVLDSLQSNFSMLPAGSQLQHPRPAAATQAITSSQGPSSVLPPGSSVGSGHSTPARNSLPPWPKMKPSDVQKYTKVFKEVDSDKDGKITGEQARNLFLSWRLPREVLKHVWELSDQDSDTMLSLREFCIALYLMERYREGRPLPTALPQSVMFDETLLSISGPPSMSYGNTGWGSGQGFMQQPGMGGARPITPPSGMRPPVPGPAPHPGSGIASNPERTQVPDLGDPFANHLSDGNSVSSKPAEAAAEGEKVDEKQNLIMDSREKLEYYRTKMQDIVLYKSRCDNRLNEITERASADKREAETLAKKYEEKYKQVAEIGSKLTIEEARFREIQERKTELRQAIINMEQGGSADGLLQVRADRIQSDLEELMKALSERCKKHGLDIKLKALVDLPTGWQPGIQEGAALWDEEWDKFEDEGFGHEITFDKSKQQENGSLDDGSPSPDSSSHPNSKEGLFSDSTERHHDGEYSSTHSDDEASGSHRGSPAAETPSPVYSNGKSAESDRFFDDSNWASAFDTTDDVDSVWGFSASKSQDGDFFGSSSGFDVNPGRADSPSVGQRKSPFVFDDSVPSTPLSRDNFESFSRFDSFDATDTGFSGERLSRFDSISSSKDLGGAFSRFDSVNSSRDFGGDKFSRSDSVNSTRDFGGPSFLRFDSINSTKDFGGSHGYSFDDADPFASSGPFRVSSDDKSPRKRSDNWNSF